MFLMFVMNVMHERKVLIGLTHLSHHDFLTTLHGLAAPASTDVKNPGGNRSTISALTRPEFSRHFLMTSPLASPVPVRSKKTAEGRL